MATSTATPSRRGAGTVFVPLDTVSDPGLVLAAIGRMAGADLGLRAEREYPAAGPRRAPDLRQLEEELPAQIRQQLSAAQFDQAFSAGFGLTQQQAVEIARDQRGTGTHGA